VLLTRQGPLKIALKTELNGTRQNGRMLPRLSAFIELFIGMLDPRSPRKAEMRNCARKWAAVLS